MAMVADMTTRKSSLQLAVDHLSDTSRGALRIATALVHEVQELERYHDQWSKTEQPQTLSSSSRVLLHIEDPLREHRPRNCVKLDDKRNKGDAHYTEEAAPVAAAEAARAAALKGRAGDPSYKVIIYSSTYTGLIQGESHTHLYRENLFDAHPPARMYVHMTTTEVRYRIQDSARC